MKTQIVKYKVILLAIGLAACTGDFEEVNTNPNSPLTTTPNLLLTGLERDMINALTTESWEIGNIVVQHTAKNQFVNEDRYLWGELNRIWTGVYDNLRDVNNILIQAEQTNQPNYRGVALILKSWMFSLATDCYGDVPYTEAMQGKEGVFFPVYDTQESIYAGILRDLEEANTLLAGATNVSGDLIYGGDVSKWRKLANSLRLRYLMRISDRKDVSAQMSAILNNSTANPIFTGNADHAVYTYQASAPNQFPLFVYRVGTFSEFRASKTMVDYLQSTTDLRLPIFFRITEATETTAPTGDDRFEGIPNGLDDVTALTYNGGQQFQSRISPFFYEQSNSEKGIQVAKGVIMTYSELQFILAEARERSIITTGTADAYYRNGISASFSFYGLTPDPAYFAQARIAYTGTTDERLEKIGTQKWVASYFQGLEAWFNWRRTGYPRLQPSVTNQNNNQIPVRFIYPRIEQSLNSKGRDAAIARQGADNINTKVWWDR
jgi:Starch-binding associating with outer membrane